MKRALITGITGQDGSYLAELLVAKGYHVAGLQQSGAPLTFIEHLRENVTLYEGDITDGDLLTEIIRKEKPDELYNLASVATVSKPWEDPLHVLKITGFAPITLLEIIKKNRHTPSFSKHHPRKCLGTQNKVHKTKTLHSIPKIPMDWGNC